MKQIIRNAYTCIYMHTQWWVSVYEFMCISVCSGGDRPYDLAPKAKAGATGMTQHVWYWRVRKKNMKQWVKHLQETHGILIFLDFSRFSLGPPRGFNDSKVFATFSTWSCPERGAQLGKKWFPKRNISNVQSLPNNLVNPMPDGDGARKWERERDKKRERERDMFRVWLATYPLIATGGHTPWKHSKRPIRLVLQPKHVLPMDWFLVRARLWEARVWWWCLGWNARPWQLGAEWATWSARIGQWNGKWNYQAKMLCWANLCRPCCEISTVETLLRYGFPIYTNVTWTIVYDRFCGRVDVWLPPVSWRLFGLDQSLKGLHRFHKRSRYRLLKTGLSDVRWCYPLVN